MIRGWRKWSVAVVALLFSFILALRGQLTPDFVNIVMTVVGAFHTANAAVSVIQAKYSGSRE
jgi:hypothetical protein